MARVQLQWLDLDWFSLESLCQENVQYVIFKTAKVIFLISQFTFCIGYKNILMHVDSFLVRSEGAQSYENHPIVTW